MNDEGPVRIFTSTRNNPIRDQIEFSSIYFTNKIPSLSINTNYGKVRHKKIRDYFLYFIDHDSALSECIKYASTA